MPLIMRLHITFTCILFKYLYTFVLKCLNNYWAPMHGHGPDPVVGRNTIQPENWNPRPGNDRAGRDSRSYRTLILLGSPCRARVPFYDGCFSCMHHDVRAHCNANAWFELVRSLHCMKPWHNQNLVHARRGIARLDPMLDQGVRLID